MNTLEDAVSWADYIQYILTLIFVIGLILGVSWALKKYGVGQLTPKNRKSKDKRLSVIEIAPLDAKRRLVLIRRDGVEHMLLTGGPNDLVIETGVPAPFSDVVKAANSDGLTLKPALSDEERDIIRSATKADDQAGDVPKAEARS